MSALTMQFHRGGVHLPELGLWLDPHQRVAGDEMAFVSHAHSDHTGAHREVILTEPTAHLMKARLGGRRVENVLAFGEQREFRCGKIPFRLTLLPAGHILGSAMAFIEAGGETLLYTGDFKLRPGLAAEICEPRRADLLIMETTFGRPAYEFPPAETVRREIVQFCRSALEREETPVLFSYSLGKSQELLAGLGDAGLPLAVHESVEKMTRIYENFGRRFPKFEPHDASNARGKVLICPPNTNAAAMLRKQEKIRTAVVTGWALDRGCRFRYQVEAAFPLSDHAGFSDLLEMVKLVAPRKVFTLHGFAADFAQSVRELGFEAQALSEQEQFLLPFAGKV